MNDNPYKTPESDLEQHTEDTQRKFYIVSIQKFTVLFFITVGLYQIYWFYKNWKEYKVQTGESLWPVMRAIFAIFFTHSLFNKIHDTLKEKSIAFLWASGSMATLFVVLSIASQILDRLAYREIGSPFTDILGLLIIPLLYIILVKAQKAINLSQDDPEGLSNNTYTMANYIWIILGVIFWLLIIIGLIDILGIINLT